MFLSPVIVVPTVSAGDSLASARGYPAVVLSGSASAWLEQPIKEGGTVQPGSNFVNNPQIGDLISSNPAALFALINDGLGSLTSLLQPLTDTQLRASAVPVSGTFWPTTQSISGNTLTTVSNFPATQSISGNTLVTVSNTLRSITGTLSAAINNWPAVQSVSGQVYANQNGAPWSMTHGKTMLPPASGTATSIGNTLIYAAQASPVCVYVEKLLTSYSTNPVTALWTAGAGGPEVWRSMLQAPANVTVGEVTTVTPPGYVFSVPANTALTLSLNQAAQMHYALAAYLG